MRKSPLNIWLVDDEMTEQFLVRRVMSDLTMPVQLHVIDSARGAMHLLESAGTGQLPDLILCDLKMPDLDGFDFLTWLRQSSWKALPLVMCSNSDIPADVTRAYSLGANAYHLKAATVEGMRECFRVLASYWGEQCQLPILAPTNSEPACSSD